MAVYVWETVHIGEEVPDKAKKLTGNNSAVVPRDPTIPAQSHSILLKFSWSISKDVWGMLAGTVSQLIIDLGDC